MTVTTQYNVERVQNYSHLPDRNADALKSKFKTLKNTRKPTGDLTCPADVRRTKHLQRDIETCIRNP